MKTLKEINEKWLAELPEGAARAAVISYWMDFKASLLEWRAYFSSKEFDLPTEAVIEFIDYWGSVQNSEIDKEVKDGN